MLVLSALISGTVQGGSNNPDTSIDLVSEIQPVEPTTASLGRYGEYQMDYSNGLPDISIPLYDIKSGDLTVPIVLRYQGGGIKVQQEATWVGMGWDLFYGGQITRVVHGFPDEKEPTASQRPTANEIRDYMKQHNLEASNSYLRNLAEGKLAAYSFMPDEFYYNAGMENGKFIGLTEKVLTPYKPVKIGGGETGWNITDSESIIYSFKINETTSTLSADHIFPSYTSAWSVEKITSPSNHVISYEYQTDGYYVFNHSPSYEGYYFSYLGMDVPWLTDDTYLHPIPLKKSSDRLKVESKKPKYIYFDGGRATFILSTRTDIKNNDNSVPVQKLDKILIERLLSNGSYESVKYFQFNYFYRENRLFLGSVDEFIFSPHASKQIAKFEYDSTPLPDKSSYSYDYCGYYNGSKNTTPIPRYDIANIRANFGTITLGGANKNVVEPFTKAGTLTSVEYPTKGKTVFTWENHRYGATLPAYPAQYTTFETVNVAGNTNRTCSSLPNPFDDGECSSLVFTNYIDQSIQITGKIERINTVNVQHEKYDNGVIRFEDFTSGTVLLKKPLLKSPTTINEVFHLVPNHTYYVTATTNCYNVSAYVGFTYNKYDTNTDKYNYPYGGLRIKEVTNYDSDGKLLDKSRFTYTDPNNTAKSSGYLTNTADILPSKHSKTVECIPCATVSNQCPDGYNYTYRYTDTDLYYDNPIVGIYPNNLSYQYVQVQKLSSDNKNNGITKYEFKTCLDDQLNSDTPLISNSSLRGQLLKESIYDNGNNLLNQTINYYSNHSGIKASSRGLKVIQGMNLTTPICTIDEITLFDLDHRYVPYDYTYYSYWCKMDSTVTYSYTGANAVQQKSEYAYNDIASCRPTQITAMLNNGKEKITNFTYPPEITKELQFATKEEKMDNTVIYKQTNHYSRVLPNPTIGRFLISFDSIRIKYGTSAEETEVKMKRNAKYNIVEYLPRSATPTTYLWGYNYQYPIAKIENATFEQVKNILGQALIDRATDAVIPATADSTTINSLRNSLPAAQVTTYTYKPLIGMATATDPQGITTYYDYDAFGRLKETYYYENNDKSKKRTVETYDYHYKD